MYSMKISRNFALLFIYFLVIITLPNVYQAQVSYDVYRFTWTLRFSHVRYCRGFVSLSTRTQRWSCRETARHRDRASFFGLDDPKISVQSKDDVYSQKTNLSSRVYLPKGIKPSEKLPLLVYFHGGGFFIESAFSPTYHNYINTLVAEAKVLAVSVDYRLAPEHPLPACYDDSWAALQWVASHASGNGPEEWLNSHADFGKVFVAGDSAGGNITYHMAMRYGREKLAGINLAGIALLHPYCWGKDPIGNESKDLKLKALLEKAWLFVCPTTSGLDDPWINPIADPNLPRLGCSNVVIFVAGEDMLRDRGWLYYDELRKSGWGGKAEIMEAKGENHCFHLFDYGSDNSKAMRKKFASSLNQEKS